MIETNRGELEKHQKEARCCGLHESKKEGKRAAGVKEKGLDEAGKVNEEFPKHSKAQQKWKRHAQTKNRTQKKKEHIPTKKERATVRAHHVFSPAE